MADRAAGLRSFSFGPECEPTWASGSGAPPVVPAVPVLPKQSSRCGKASEPASAKPMRYYKDDGSTYASMSSEAGASAEGGRNRSTTGASDYI